MISGNGKGNGGAQFETNVEQMDSLAHSFSRVDYDRDFGAFSHTLLRQSLRRFEIEIKQQQNKKKRVTRNQTKKKTGKFQANFVGGDRAVDRRDGNNQSEQLVELVLQPEALQLFQKKKIKENQTEK